MEMGFTDSRPLAPGDSSHGLRPLGWSELCARLVAAHDTRQVFGGPVTGSMPGPGLGPSSGEGTSPAGSHAGKSSFHQSAAVLLQTIEMELKAPVNPSPSVNGNDVEGRKGQAPNAALQRRPDEKCHD